MQFSVHTQDQCTSCKDRHKARACCEDQARREAEDQARHEEARHEEARHEEARHEADAKAVRRVMDRLRPMILFGNSWNIDYYQGQHRIHIHSDLDGICFFQSSSAKEKISKTTPEFIGAFLADVSADGHLVMTHPTASIFEKIIGELVYRSYLDDALSHFRECTIDFLHELGDDGFRITPKFPVVCFVPETRELWIQQTRTGGQ